jgi:hypothetical protein
MNEPFSAADRRGGEWPDVGRGESASGDLDRSISSAAERIQAILDAATEAASQIRADAREDARREADRLTMRRIAQMSQLTDSLVERAERVRREADELTRAIEDAMRAVVTATNDVGVAVDAEESDAGGPGGTPASHFDPTERPLPAQGRARETPAMRAARMAIDGRPREEIGVTLTREYGIRDPNPILNEVLGRDG